MIKRAYELTGYGITIETFTKMEFDEIKQTNPGISLDQAILIFEKAPEHMTLGEFAKQKSRTATGYRSVYRKYFQREKASTSEKI